jgi:4-hydroxythreonine-4-phosphate dehydrogenase
VASSHAGPVLHRQEALSRPRQTPPLIALTSGEPAGIGPDICLTLALDDLDARLAVLGDPAAFAARAAALGLTLAIDRIDAIADAPAHRAGRLALVPVELAVATEPGRPDPANASAVVEMLRLATAACLDGGADALVTGPVQKSVIDAAGIEFSGHTEFLGRLTGAAGPVMLLASPRLKVALVTTHLPLAAVPAAITRAKLGATIRTVDRDLRRRFGLDRPRILVLGLNPHAGENGMLGSEERDTIGPVVAELQVEGLRLIGPVSADSAFTQASLARCDVVVAMYHDQGLPVIKARDFGDTVNVTLGLPIVRTSVDHGTALTLAGTGRASHASLRAAVDLALELASAAR